MTTIDAFYRQRRRIEPVAYFVKRPEAERLLMEYKQEVVKLGRLKNRKPSPEPKVKRRCHDKEHGHDCDYWDVDKWSHDCCTCGCCMVD